MVDVAIQRLRASAVSPAGRLAWVDQLRGAALILAASDHVWLLAFGATGWWRLPARPAVYVLAMLSGALFKPGSTRRRLQLLAAGIASTVIGSHLGLLFPDVLLVFAAAHFLMIRAVRAPVIWFVAALTVGLSVPLWAGYQVGVILAVMLAGHFAAQVVPLWSVGEFSRPGPVARGVAWVGAHPLTFWLAHLAALLVWVVSA